MSTTVSIPPIEMGRPASIRAAPRDSKQLIGYQIRNLNIPKAWQATEGEGVRVGVVDTGCYTEHPDLGAVKADHSNERLHPHGSHVAGIIGARNNEEGMVGVAPGVLLHSYQALNGEGYGTDRTVSRAIYDAIDDGCNVINLSLGAKKPSRRIHRAVKRAYQAGIAVVCAAGNAGKDGGLDWPARYPETIAVGAINEDRRRAAFSQTGPQLDWAAPGVHIVSTVPRDDYQPMSGTSMAAPWLSGVIALLLSYETSLSDLSGSHQVDEIREALQAASMDLNSVGRDPRTGWGIVNPLELDLKDDGDDGPATDDLVVSRMQVNVPGKATPGNMSEEWVEFRNESARRLDLEDWVLVDRAGWTYVFPPLHLDPGCSVMLHTGEGRRRSGHLYWGYRRPIWNNDGDSLLIKDTDGLVRCRFSY